MTPAALAALAKGDMENFIAASRPGGIEAQEKAGQIEQSFAETLPKEMGSHRANFEKLGFVFGKAVDDIFVEAKFPHGWRKKPTDHSMWSEILDDKGRARGAIFYKAAFYDRSAHCSLTRRFGVSRTYDKSKPVIVFVTDACGIVNQKVEGLEIENYSLPDTEYLKQRNAITEAETWLKTWLTAQYPDWQDVCAYWD